MSAALPFVVRIAAGAALVYALVLALLWWGQERLLFLPEPLPADHRFAFGDDVQERWFDVPGARLNALHLRLPRPDGVVLYLHGNAGNLQGWFVNADFWRRANHDLVMIDYRGYGKSSGRVAGEAQLHADVRAVRDALAAEYAGQRLVVVGRSLGSGLAAALAADLADEASPALTVLVSPYTSIAALAAEHYPWVPGALLRYALRTDLALPRIRGPVLLLHGEADTVIPPAHSQALQAIRPDARLVVVPGAGHNDLQQFPVYLDALRAALAASR